MSDIPKKIVVDCSTGKITELPFTPAEIAQRDQDAAAWAERQAAKEAEEMAEAEKKTSALAKLSALGLTEDEAKLLLS